MPAIFINKCNQFQEILKLIGTLPPHNWLVSNLDCFDYSGWDGCEKWANETMILTDEELRKDIMLRNPRFIWGAFSAITIEHTKEEINSYELPWLENPYYMSNMIVPQHPLAFLEISVFDGCYTIVSSKDKEIIEPLCLMQGDVHDEEASNQRMNAELRRIQDMLRAMVPDVLPEIANEVQWKCWHALFRESIGNVFDAKLKCEIKKWYEHTTKSTYKCSTTFWDPYTQ
jgi:hypothetical protein